MHTDPMSEDQSTALECGVCEDHFSVEGEKIPRLLQCGHTLCQSCLFRLPVARGNKLCCPFDRQITEVGANGVSALPKNYALLELLERYESERKRKGNEGRDGHVLMTRMLPLVPCDEDPSHSASLYCLTCGTNLCESCSTSTHAGRTLTKHRRVSIHDKPRQHPKCPEHPSHPTEFVCLESQCLCCLMCIVCKDYGKHTGHRHNLVTSEAEKTKTLLLSSLQKVHALSQDVQAANEHIAKVIREIQGPITGNANEQQTRGTAEEASQRVRDHFTQMRDVLAKQEEAGLQLVSQYVDDRLQSFREHLDKLTALDAQVAKVSTECHQTLLSDDIRIVQTKFEVLALVENIVQQQEHHSRLISEVKCAESEIPVAFAQDNAVHIGINVEMRVLVLGLDNAGKTAVLFKLKQNEFIPTIPTIGFNVETLEHGHSKLTLWDVGGMEKIRPLWRHYYHNTQAVMYVVDAEDSDRFSEVNEELSKLMGEPQLKETGILVLANKQDVPGALHCDVVSESLALHKVCCGRTWNIIGSSARTGEGLSEALQWLSTHSVRFLLESETIEATSSS